MCLYKPTNTSGSAIKRRSKGILVYQLLPIWLTFAQLLSLALHPWFTARAFVQGTIFEDLDELFDHLRILGFRKLSKSTTALKIYEIVKATITFADKQHCSLQEFYPNAKTK